MRIKNCLGLHEKRASPPRRDLIIVYARYRLVGLEIFHINATEGLALLALLAGLKKAGVSASNSVF